MKKIMEGMGEEKKLKDRQKRKKIYKKYFYITFTIFFLILNMNYIKGETDQTQSTLDIHKLEFSNYVVIEPISEKEYKLEVIMCFTNVSSEQINWILTIEVPEVFITDPGAEWSSLDRKKWKDIPPNGKIEKEVDISPGNRDGIIVKSIEDITIEDGERHIGYKVLGTMHYNSIEVKIPIKEDIFYKIDYIRWELPPDSIREEEDYRVLKWEKSIPLQTGELTNIFRVYYEYRMPIKEYFVIFLKEVGIALLGVIIGVLLSERIRKIHKKLKNKIEKK